MENKKELELQGTGARIDYKLILRSSKWLTGGNTIEIPVKNKPTEEFIVSMLDETGYSFAKVVTTSIESQEYDYDFNTHYYETKFPTPNDLNKVGLIAENKIAEETE